MQEVEEEAQACRLLDKFASFVPGTTKSFSTEEGQYVMESKYSLIIKLLQEIFKK